MRINFNLSNSITIAFSVFCEDFFECVLENFSFRNVKMLINFNSLRATVEISNVVKKGEIDTWLTLEQVKHGMVHLRLTWMQLSSDKNDLKIALEETQLLRVSDMSTALLTVFIDSAKNLPVNKNLKFFFQLILN
jgi:hypothetical protein